MAKKRRIDILADDLAESLSLFRRGEIQSGNVWGLIDFQREVEEFLDLLAKQVDKENKAQGNRLETTEKATPRKPVRPSRS